MKFIFRDLNRFVVDAVATEFAEIESADIRCEHIFQSGICADAIISPANCIGRMDGGIDAIYVQFFGWQLQARLSHHLIERYQDNLWRVEIGDATTVITGNTDIPIMIMAPTMDWPPADVSTTQNAYLAFKAALLCCRKNNLSSILTPGLATLTGRMSAKNCAVQMRKAWDEVYG